MRRWNAKEEKEYIAKLYAAVILKNKSKKTISSVLKTDYALVQHTRTYLSSYCQSTINPSTNVGNSSHLFINKKNTKIITYK